MTAPGRNWPRRKLIYQRKSGKEAQLTVLTWSPRFELWSSQNYGQGTAKEISAVLRRWTDHLSKTGQPFTLIREDYRRRKLPSWFEIVKQQNRRPWQR